MGEVGEARKLLDKPLDVAMPSLHAWRLTMLAFAAQRLPLVEYRAILAEVRRHPDANGDFLTMMSSKLAYRNGDYELAAREAERAAMAARRTVVRAERWASAAAAWLEVADWSRAVELAERAGALASEARAPIVEFQARWVERVARYRTNEALTPSTAFLAAAAAISTRLQGMAGYIEATIAWRAADRAQAIELAAIATQALRGTQQVSAGPARRGSEGGPGDLGPKRGKPRP